MKKDPFDFTTWIAESVSTASIEVVKKAMKTLESLESQGLSSIVSPKHSFYISFVTKDMEVILPEFLKKTYPKTITIVLENQFENLKVEKGGFFVSLSFNNKLQNIYIPFKAIVNFSDRGLNLNIPIMYDSNRLTKELTNSKNRKSSKLITKNLSNDTNIIEFKKR